MTLNGAGGFGGNTVGLGLVVFGGDAQRAGVEVGAVRYVASQPWPFPSQLMIACIGQALTDQIMLDTNELEDAKWVSRAEVLAVLNGTGDAFIAPPPYAIAHTLLDAWARELA